jgi:hypothetical protein
VAVAVGVGIGVDVAVGVGVDVAVAVGVELGVEVGVEVAVGVGEGVGEPPPGVNVRFADCDVVPMIAVMATTVLLVTVDVVMVKLADVCPAAIVTTPGAEA